MPSDFEGKVCEYCGLPAISVIRTRYACGKCFSIIRRDNIYKWNHNIEITKNTTVRGKCSTFSCFRRVDKQPNELTKIYCDKCLDSI